MYLLIASGVVYSCLRHAIPHLSPGWRCFLALVLFVCIASLGCWGTLKQYQREHAEVSKAQIVLLGVKPVVISTADAWPGVNIAFQNVGSMPAHAVSGSVTVTVKPFQLSEEGIKQAQDDLLGRTDWLSALRRHKGEELDNGAPGLAPIFDTTG
jgi:hypothetical protein